MTVRIVVIVLFLAAALLAAAAAAKWLLARRRARRSRRTTPRARFAPRHPVLLAHGLFGFDELRLGSGRVEYWKGVPRALRKMGVDVAVPRFDAAASVERRAGQLAEAIRAIDSKKVNIVAHSMGGVDARLAIAEYGVADRVASLVSVASPHRGTPLASLGSIALGPFSRPSKKKRKRVAAAPKADDSLVPRRGGLDMGGVRDARPDSMRAFNKRIRDDERVHYASVVGSVEGVGRLHPLLIPGYLFLSGSAGRNDGVVPEESQAWGDVIARVEADHWAVVGWSKGFDAPDFYERIVRELAARGY